MTYTVFFVATVIVVSGLIAYLGDLLGRRMGKRRLSLFGLRPRYTAIVMTTITGMLIAGLTIAALLGISRGLRDMFVRGERLLRENRAYQVRNRELRSENRRLVESRRKLTGDVLDKTRQVAQAKREVAAAQQARDRANALVGRLEVQIRSEQATLRKLELSGRLTGERLRAASTKLKRLGEELVQRKSELAQRNRELREKESDLAQKSRDLAAKVAALDKAEQDIRRAEVTIVDYEKTIREQRAELAETTKMLLTGNVVLPQGQELARRVIDSKLDPNQIRSELVELLDKAGEEAKLAQAGAESGSRAIRLVFEDKANGIWIEDENLCLDAAVKAIIEQGRERQGRGVLAQIIVANNTLRGRQAPAVLWLYWNNLAFQRGERIATATIDGRLSEGRILLAVMDLLREDVRSSAQEKGIVPVAGPDPERAAQPISEDQLDRVMELVEAIRSQSKKVEVRAIARTDIYQADWLNLDNIEFAISTLTRAAN